MNKKNISSIPDRILLLETDNLKYNIINIFIKFLKVFILSLRYFIHNQCTLRSSSLSLYTLLSIVPIVAMAFGIAQGFGLENILEKWLHTQFRGQEEILTWFLTFAKTMLDRAKGGIIAGVGVLFLFWSVFRVLWHIEQAFNAIWKLNIQRNIQQKFNDYVFILVVCPMMIIISSSISIFIVSHTSHLVHNTSILAEFDFFILPVLHLIPYSIVWILFSFMYSFLPNTKVNSSSSIIAGIIAGSMYVLCQWGYLHSQIAISEYNAIYGSFAALPIFIIWIDVSWTIVLFGAQFTFIHQNSIQGKNVIFNQSFSYKQYMLIILHIISLCIKKFEQGKQAASLKEIADYLQIPLMTAQKMTKKLCSAEILVKINSNEGQGRFQPAISPNLLTMQLVVSKLQNQEKDGISLPAHLDASRLSLAFEQFNQDGSPDKIGSLPLYHFI